VNKLSLTALFRSLHAFHHSKADKWWRVAADIDTVQYNQC